MFVVKYRKIFFALSTSLIILSVYGFLSYGLKYSIDFKGGTITEVSYDSGILYSLYYNGYNRAGASF